MQKWVKVKNGGTHLQPQHVGGCKRILVSLRPVWATVRSRPVRLSLKKKKRLELQHFPSQLEALLASS